MEETDTNSSKPSVTNGIPWQAVIRFLITSIFMLGVLFLLAGRQAGPGCSWGAFREQGDQGDINLGCVLCKQYPWLGDRDGDILPGEARSGCVNVHAQVEIVN